MDLSRKAGRKLERFGFVINFANLKPYQNCGKFAKRSGENYRGSEKRSGANNFGEAIIFLTGLSLARWFKNSKIRTLKQARKKYKI